MIIPFSLLPLLFGVSIMFRLTNTETGSLRFSLGNQPSLNQNAGSGPEKRRWPCHHQSRLNVSGGFQMISRLVRIREKCFSTKPPGLRPAASYPISKKIHEEPVKVFLTVGELKKELDLLGDQR